MIVMRICFYGYDSWMYVKAFDVDAPVGSRIVDLVADVSGAMQFPNMETAIDAWRTQSKSQPLRPDGQPNRPLTAYHAMFEEIT